jgi:ankyrin repeat protein
MTPIETMFDASRTGNYTRVLQLLDQDPALANAATMLGSRPIHAAHFGGHQRVVDLLLARGTPMDIFLASELGKLEFVRAALAADSLRAQAFSDAGSTALHCSCYWGQVEAAGLLLKGGADPNAVMRDSFLQIRPLGCAVATPDVPNPSDREEVVLQLVSLLIAHGADVNGRRRDGLTPLHGAAFRGHLAVLHLLLHHGADPALQGYEGAGPHAGKTASDLAASQGQHESVAFLAHHRPR